MVRLTNFAATLLLVLVGSASLSGHASAADTDGYYYDTTLCDWFTTSSYKWSGRMKIEIDVPECVLTSEL